MNFKTTLVSLLPFLLLQPALSAPKPGKWDAPITMPLVPVAAAVLPSSGKVLIWAAFRPDVFYGPPTEEPWYSPWTVASLYDPATNTSTERNISETHHDMFCPGISLDFAGRPIVTGGNTSPRTSIYDAGSDTWQSGHNMTLARGYQSTTMTSDGRMFTIGGSWSGGIGGKNGEIYTPSSDTWDMLPGCPVGPILTNDVRGEYCSDNHAWLFGWKDGSVFHAGPSVTMNWFDTKGSGSQSSAGSRTDDLDSMNGNAIMYDAVAGKILTVGGALSYGDSPAHPNARIITIDTPFSTPTVEIINPMHFSRTFANSVVLPDGTVFISGGQSYAHQFTDFNSSMTPELFSPTDKSFTLMAEMTVPRNYHSLSILLPDGRVLTGGGGLCGPWPDCYNHFDLQIYSPGYLFNEDGSLASRPSITSTSTDMVKVGGELTVKVEGEVGAMSIVRYGSVTHSINTDQRRISLDFVANGGTLLTKLPGDSGVALPGYWMLFVIDKAGVPSTARTILVTL